MKKEEALTEAEKEKLDDSVKPMPNETQENVTVPIKFNKENKHLTIEEAAALAQKGMKYDLIKNDYERIKRIAQKEGLSVGGFITLIEEKMKKTHEEQMLERCAGNESLCSHILKLEQEVNRQSNDDFKELQEFFPKLKEPSELPAEVIEASETKGTALLDEYLRYLLKLKRAKEKATAENYAAEKSSTGSQSGFNSNGHDASRTAFIRSLWGN